MKKRIKWLDIMKGLAMLMVIYSHVEYHPSVPMSFLAPVFLTVFFFTGGYTFNCKDNFASFLKGKIKGLFIPWLSLGLINIFLTQLLTFNEKIPLQKQIIELLLQNGRGGNRLWFIAAMFEGCLIFYFVIKLLDRKRIHLFVGLLFILLSSSVIWKRIDGSSLPWHLDCMGSVCFWMGVGKLFNIYGKKIEEKLRSGWMLILEISVYILLLWINSYFLKTNYVAFSDYGNSILIYLLLSIDGLFWMISLSMCIEKNDIVTKMISFVGLHSMLYFALHGKAMSLVNKIISVADHYIHLELEADYPLLMTCVVVILVVISLYLPIYLIGRYIPFLEGKTKNIR